jgi:proline racemase
VIRRIRTIDAHAAGEPLRLIVDGFPTVHGRTMLEKRAWLRKRHDRLRRAVMLEPRGHADMYGAILTEPVSPDADAGVLFMHNEGYSTMCGHGIIAVTTIALERGLVAGRAADRIVFDTPAGSVPATARLKPCPASKVENVSFENVPSFILHAGLSVRANGRDVRVDVAFGGAFYAIVDSEALGIPLRAERLPQLRAAGMEIKHAVEKVVEVVHPLEPDLRGMYGSIVTGPPNDPAADLRNVTIFADAEVDRSPCGTGTAAVMAVVDAMGLLSSDRPFAHESLIGTIFRGHVVGRAQVGEINAIVPAIEGSAWITGEHTFLLDDDDPLRDGFRL